MGKPPSTRTSAEVYALTGPSDPPDPGHYAYRKDLADVAIADRVLASHYASAVDRNVVATAPLRAGPSDEAEELGILGPGEPFAAIEDSVGWAWGYAGKNRRVGYVRSEALSPGLPS